MLRKLMKYEFRATGRMFLPLFAALLIISAVNRLLLGFQLEAPSVIGIIIAVILIVGIFVLTIVLTVQRFRKNLMSNEGHLMMTLPVKTDDLIISKLFVSTVWTLASFIVVTLSILIMASIDFSFSDVAFFFRELSELLSSSPLQSAVYIVEAILWIILVIFSSILILYACMSLSMLVNKRRGLFTFGAFIAISTMLQILFTALILVLRSGIFDGLLSILDGMSAFGQTQVFIPLLFLAQIILCTAFYMTTRHMLKNKLNLL